MPPLKTYDLFVSHVWRSNENSEYYRLCRMLSESNNLSWRNYSVPEDDPLGTKTDTQLREALHRQIRPVNCFLVISGMYANYRKWIQEELLIAQYYNKPIVGVIPWGQERVPSEVQNASITMVAWQTTSIIEAIRKHSL